LGAAAGRGCDTCGSHTGLAVIQRAVLPNGVVGVESSAWIWTLCLEGLFVYYVVES